MLQSEEVGTNMSKGMPAGIFFGEPEAILLAQAHIAMMDKLLFQRLSDYFCNTSKVQVITLQNGYALLYQGILEYFDLHFSDIAEMVRDAPSKREICKVPAAPPAASHGATVCRCL